MLRLVVRPLMASAILLACASCARPARDVETPVDVPPGPVVPEHAGEFVLDEPPIEAPEAATTSTLIVEGTPEAAKLLRERLRSQMGACAPAVDWLPSKGGTVLVTRHFPPVYGAPLGAEAERLPCPFPNTE